jgi:hypothetical protein
MRYGVDDRIVLAAERRRWRPGGLDAEMIPAGTAGRVHAVEVLGRYIQIELDDEPGVIRLADEGDVLPEGGNDG